MTFRRLAVALLATATLIGCSKGTTSAVADAGSATTAASSAAPPVTDVGRAVAFTVATPPPVSLDPICDSASVCLVPLKGPEYTVTGDAQGTGVNAGAAYLLPGGAGALSAALSTFSGSIDGCGHGTIVERYEAHYGADQQGGGTGTWAYVDGTGTGDFTHLSGGGEFHLVTSSSDLSATDAFTGHIRC